MHPPRERLPLIGRDHLLAFGLAAEQIANWIAEGHLGPSPFDDFYLRTPAFDALWTRLRQRRLVGRAHLLHLGVTGAVVARWIRQGTLRTTRERGFYEITLAAWERLHSDAVATSTAAPPARDVGSVTPTAEPAAPAEVGSVTTAETAPVEEAVASQPRLRVVACTITSAREFVARHHRHLPAPTSGLFAVGVAQAGAIVGVAIVGRPSARGLQDGATAEVTRVCTTGARNACSMLLGACRRGAVALGYTRLLTYTLTSEPGASLRAAGWREVARVRGRGWNCPSRPRRAAKIHDKRRWEAPLLASNRRVVDDERGVGHE